MGLFLFVGTGKLPAFLHVCLCFPLSTSVVHAEKGKRRRMYGNTGKTNKNNPYQEQHVAVDG